MTSRHNMLQDQVQIKDSVVDAVVLSPLNKRDSNFCHPSKNGNASLDVLLGVIFRQKIWTPLFIMQMATSCEPKEKKAPTE